MIFDQLLRCETLIKVVKLLIYQYLLNIQIFLYILLLAKYEHLFNK